jgi:F-type H+-transporting ATPase subunit delta
MTSVDLTVYGRALFLAAKEEDVIETVFNDLSYVRDALSQSPEYSRLLDTPALSRDEKHRIITEAFGGLDHLLVNLIKMLSDKGLFFGFERLHKSYCSLYDEHLGIERAEAVTARPLSEMQSLALCEKLEKITGKRIILTNTLDPDILGGIRITYSGVQLDGSLKRRLCDIEKGLKNTII